MESTTPTPLRAALENLRLDGAIFFRAEFTENWAFESPLTELTRALRPGASSMILFHIVAAGRCWISTPGGERHWANRGDVIALPYGDDYSMGGAEPAEVVPILTLMTRPPWATMPVLEHGAGGDRTDILCGHMYSDDPLFDRHTCVPVGVRGAGAGWSRSALGCVQHQLRAGGHHGIASRAALVDPASRAVAHRGAADTPGDGTDGRTWVDRRAA